MVIRTRLIFVTLILTSAIPFFASSEAITALELGPNEYDLIIRAVFPETERYEVAEDEYAAPVVINVPAIFSVEQDYQRTFQTTPAFEDEGFIHVTYLIPGTHVGNPPVHTSEGDYDAGGVASAVATQAVIDFVTDNGVTDEDGNTFSQWVASESGPTPLTDNVGLFAFSNPGILVTHALSYGSWSNSYLAWYVGGENPTEDVIIERDLGFDTTQNGHYDGSTDYDSTAIGSYVSYTPVTWDGTDDCPSWSSPTFLQDTPPVTYYIDSDWHLFYSTPMSYRLDTIGGMDSWIATPSEASNFWSIRQSVEHYDGIPTSFQTNLHVMLVFWRTDHKQPAQDKPHVHQAYDGFRDEAGLWTQLNPSRVTAIDYDYANLNTNYPQNDANTEPSDWFSNEPRDDWAWPGTAPAKGGIAAVLGVCEMADRQQANDWDVELAAVLCSYTGTFPCTP